MRRVTQSMDVTDVGGEPKTKSIHVDPATSEAAAEPWLRLDRLDVSCIRAGVMSGLGGAVIAAIALAFTARS